MFKSNNILALVVATTLSIGYQQVPAQDYPQRPIRIITTPAGGGNDISARNIAFGVAGPLGQNVIVENRPAKVVGQMVARAQADGYTLLLAGGSFALTPLLEKTPYDPVRDFASIAIVDTSPNILVVHPTLLVKSVKELIALVRTKPGALNYSSGGAGSDNHLAAELFKALAAINITHIPFGGSGPAVAALVAGQVHVMIPNVSAAMGHVKADRLRALAVGSAEPSALAPGLPTISASGVPGYEASSVHVILAPAGTPVRIINRLNREIVAFLNLPDTRAKLLRSGVEVVASSPQELSSFIKADMLKWGKLIKDAGIRTD